MINRGVWWRILMVIHLITSDGKLSSGLIPSFLKNWHFVMRMIENMIGLPNKFFPALVSSWLWTIVLQLTLTLPEWLPRIQPICLLRFFIFTYFTSLIWLTTVFLFHISSMFHLLNCFTEYDSLIWYHSYLSDHSIAISYLWRDCGYIATLHSI